MSNQAGTRPVTVELINRLYWNLADHAGSPKKRIIGYANAYDFQHVACSPGLRAVIGAGYGSN